MDFQSVKECAERLNMNVRTVQKWANENKIPGAKKMGRDWLIPIDFVKTDTQNLPNIVIPMLSGNFEIGKSMEFIESIEDENERALSLGEYYYFRGEFDKASETFEPFLDNENLSVRLSAALFCIFASLALNHTHLAQHSAMIVKKTFEETKASDDNELKAIGILVASTILTQLHIKSQAVPDIVGYIKHLPIHLKPFACYLLAYQAYIDHNFERSLGIADTALACITYHCPLSEAYLNVISAINLINLMRIDEAKNRIDTVYHLTHRSSFLMPFVEHHSLLQGTVEAYFKNAHPDTYKKIISIVSSYNIAWSRIYNMMSDKNLASNLSPIEFTVAMLYSRGWKVKDIADHIGLSERTVRGHLQVIYEKLYINNRRDLIKYMFE